MYGACGMKQVDNPDSRMAEFERLTKQKGTKMRYTGIARSAEEITGQKGCLSFEGDDYRYSKDMNLMAGLNIELTPYDGTDFYAQRQEHRSGCCYKWHLSWLRDIQAVDSLHITHSGGTNVK